MRIAFCAVLTILLARPVLGQTTRYTLSLKTDDKITIHGFSYWQDLYLRSKDTTFHVKLHRNNPDEIKNLKAGTYTVTATSLFHHSVSKKVEVNKKTPLVKMKGLQAFYKRIDATKCLSEKLKLNDTLFILFNASNDEQLKEKIAVTKTAEGYKALQYQGIGREVFQEMLLKDGLYQQVVKFEKEGKKANSPKGDTAPKAEVYTINLKREIISFLVPGEWNGLSNLKAQLFLVEQK